MYVKKEIRDGVCVMSLNKPEVHNAFDDEASAELIQALAWARDSREFKVLLLRGEGRSFCTGRDVRKMGERPPGMSHYEFMKAGQAQIRGLLDLGKPYIAAVRGAAIGGGAELAMIADFRIGSTDLKFSLPECKYGLAVDQGGSALAASLIGPARTKYLLMSGDSIDGKTAYEWGLIDFLLPPEEVDAKAFEIAARIAKNPGRAVLAGKELVDELWADGIRAAIRRELTQQLALFASEDFLELREKRRTQAAAK
ncbi:MAG: enoyl-CoA hydratase/isomerase family protein [Gammaproteobacteria bacterium]